MIFPGRVLASKGRYASGFGCSGCGGGSSCFFAGKDSHALCRIAGPGFPVRNDCPSRNEGIGTEHDPVAYRYAWQDYRAGANEGIVANRDGFKGNDLVLNLVSRERRIGPDYHVVPHGHGPGLGDDRARAGLEELKHRRVIVPIGKAGRANVYRLGTASEVAGEPEAESGDRDEVLVERLKREFDAEEIPSEGEHEVS